MLFPESKMVAGLSGSYLDTLQDQTGIVTKTHMLIRVVEQSLAYRSIHIKLTLWGVGGHCTAASSAAIEPNTDPRAV